MIIKYYNFIKETLESPAIINWSNDTHSMKGTFYVQRFINGAKINLKFVILSRVISTCEDINAWDYKFYWSDGGDIVYSLTGSDKNKFKILSTVVKGFKDLMEKKSPDSIIFKANLKEDSRVKFYNRLMETAKSEYGFKLHKFTYSDTGNLKDSGIAPYLVYILYKNEDHLQRLIEVSKEKSSKSFK
jgi:hypothetical protein